MSLCDKCIHKDVCKNVTNVNESEGVVCPNRLVILFLCDKRADCKSPCYPDCHHTTDVRHAKNFERVQQYSDLDSGYRVFKEIEFENCLDSETDEGRPGEEAIEILYKRKEEDLRKLMMIGQLEGKPGTNA